MSRKHPSLQHDRAGATFRSLFSNHKPSITRFEVPVQLYVWQIPSPSDRILGAYDFGCVKWSKRPSGGGATVSARYVLCTCRPASSWLKRRRNAGVFARTRLQLAYFGQSHVLTRFGQKPYLDHAVVSTFGSEPYLDQVAVSILWSEPYLDQTAVSMFWSEPYLDQVAVSIF
jgi:hypothetical protein